LYDSKDGDGYLRTSIFRLDSAELNQFNKPEQRPRRPHISREYPFEMHTRPTLTVVNTTATRVPNFLVATQNNVTNTTAATAVILMAHWGISSGETSARAVCQKIRLRYSEKMRLMTAFPPGFSAIMAVHANKYETRGPYA
jgi:hypothetical protein